MSDAARSPLFAAARARAAQSPFFLAHDLAAYAGFHGLSQTGLAKALECSPLTLDVLSLCRSPYRDDRFRAEVEAIGTRFEIDFRRLATLLRETDALTGFAGLDNVDGWLAAARDREPGDVER
jgi:hypothetical protein